MKTDTLEQIAAQLIGCCFMPPDHRYDIPDDLEREAARQTAQEIIAIAIKSPEAAEYQIDRALKILLDTGTLSKDGATYKAIEALKEPNKNFNLKNWQYCHKHGGIGFVSDCVECKKELF